MPLSKPVMKFARKLPKAVVFSSEKDVVFAGEC